MDGTVEGGPAWLEAPDAKGESTTSTWGTVGDYAARVGELNAGGVLVLGSDYPVAPFAALPIMADAQLRHPVEDAETPPVLPDHGLSPAEALAGYTTEPFAAIGEEGGFIAVGEPATFTVLDVDPLAVAPEELRLGRVRLTVSDGIITYRRD